MSSSNLRSRLRYEPYDGRAHDRVRRHTAPQVNERIDQVTRATLEERAEAGRDAMVARLQDLNREWDVDRALMANFAVLSALAFTLGRRHHPAWTYLLRAQQAFLLMHAVVGWCPPLPIFRRLGFRTSKEIEAERAVLTQQLIAPGAAQIGAG